MTARWTPGVVIALPIVAMFVAILLGFTAYAWSRGNERDYGMMPSWRIAAWATTVVSALLVVALPWAWFPFSAQYHRYVPKAGTVDIIGGRYTSGTTTGDTSGNVFDDYVVQFLGSSTRYDCQDTRCALVHPGDHLILSCIRSYQWSGTSGWDCNYVRDSAVSA